jgi:hypothetical protein
MTFERTTDWALVREILTDPAVYPHISDDGSPAREDFQVVEHPSFLYVLVKDAGAVLGLWLFVPQSVACYEVHTCLLPRARGDRAKEAARQMADWLWANTPCQKLITSVPAYNRLALHFAKRAGMTQFGTNTRSYLKHGELHDQILLGLERPKDLPKCQQL